MDCIRTSCSTVEGYLQAVTSRQDVTCRRCRRQGGRHVTSRQDVTAPPWTRRPSRHVTSRHVTSGCHMAPPWTRRPSRHVTSGHHRRRRGQGCRHVTSCQDVAAWTRQDARPSRHVTSRRRRPQRGPCSLNCRNPPLGLLFRRQIHCLAFHLKLHEPTFL